MIVLRHVVHLLLQVKDFLFLDHQLVVDVRLVFNSNCKFFMHLIILSPRLFQIYLHLTYLLSQCHKRCFRITELLSQLQSIQILIQSRQIITHEILRHQVVVCEIKRVFKCASFS